MEVHAKALGEAARVPKLGGKLAIADIRHARVYAKELAALGLKTRNADRLVFACGSTLAPG